MAHGAVQKFDIDDGWALEELPDGSGAGAEAEERAAEPDCPEAVEAIDDGWSLEELPARQEHAPAPAEEPERRRGNIVRLPGKVVIYPRRAVREKKLSSFWQSAMAQDA